MALFDGIAERLFSVVGQLKPASDRLPITKAKWIWSEQLTRDGSNDVDTLLKWLNDNKGDAGVQERLKLAVGDIVVGEKVVPNWGLVNASGAEGGMASSQGWTLETAKAASYSAPSLQAPGNGAFYVARVPLGSDPRHYAMREPDDHFGDIDAPLNQITHLGSDANWDYYEERVRFFGLITLRRSTHLVGVNTWGGKLGSAALDEVREIARALVAIWARADDETPIPVEKLDLLRTEVERMIESFASHQEQVVSELPDPTHAEAPGFAYLARKWEPTQGADGHQGTLGYSVGEYEKTTGTVNRAKVRMSKQAFAGQTIWGFAQRGDRLVTVGDRAVPDLGECIHNPLGGAMPALYMVPFNLSAGTHEFWTCWVKTDLALGGGPWDVPAPTGQNNVHRFLVRVYYKQGNSTLNFEIPMSIGGHGDTRRIIDGVSYTAMFSGENVQNQPGEGWIKGLDINDIDASTVEVEFYHSINGVRTGPLWLGGEEEAWTWRDPDEVPGTNARISRVERGSMVRGELLASIRGPSGGPNLDERPWTVAGGVTGVSHENSGGNSEGSWSKYLKLDCDHFAQSVADGSNGIIIESVRSGVILSTVFVPWSMFNTNWSADHEFFAGKTNTGKSNAATLYASCGVNNGDFHLRLAGGNATDALTVNIYRNN